MKIFLIRSKQMIYVNKTDWTRQQLAGIQRRFAVMIFSITALIVTCLLLQARYPYFFEFEDADFDYKVTPIGKPWHADFKYNVLLNGHCHTNNRKCTLFDTCHTLTT
jgi:hypothetical protein